jgi:hypothetical protein
MEEIEYLRQLHESFLAELEGLAIQALISGDWDKVQGLIDDFKSLQSRGRESD